MFSPRCFFLACPNRCQPFDTMCTPCRMHQKHLYNGITCSFCNHPARSSSHSRYIDVFYCAQRQRCCTTGRSFLLSRAH